MRHPALRVLIALLYALPACAQASEPPPLPEFAVADRLVPTDAMPERVIQWPHPSVTMTDVVYSTVPGFRALHLDLYRPVGAAAPQPLIVFVHGGAYTHANARAGGAFTNLPAVLAYLAERGYVVASIEYRFSGEAPFPAQLEDLQAAIRFLRGNAARLGIDGHRVATWGMSAGAQLAGLNAVECAAGTCVQGFVGWFGAYDLASYVRESPRETGIRPLLGCGAAECAARVLEAASPLHYVDRTDPPTLLVHGLADTNALPSQSERFGKKLREAGVDARVVLIPGTAHGFVGENPAVTQQALRQALAETFEFFDRVLR
jgi:acetyl esterase/lipase